MHSNTSSENVSTPILGQAIGKTIIISFLIIFIIFIMNGAFQLSIGKLAFLWNLISLGIFLFFDLQEEALRNKVYYLGYYPPDYQYFKSFLIINLFFYLFLNFIKFSTLADFFIYLFTPFVSAFVAIIPYLQTMFKNQKVELDIQKKQLSQLATKINNIPTSLSDDKNKEVASEKAKLNEEKAKLDEEKVKSEPSLSSAIQSMVDRQTRGSSSEPTLKGFYRQPRFDSQTGKPLTEQPIPNPNQRQRFDPQTGRPLTIESNQIITESNVSQPSNQAQSRLFSSFLQGFSEKFSNYFFLGSILFIIIAIISWFFVFVPGSHKIALGSKTWITGDMIVILGVFIIIVSETILTKRHYSDVIPLNYLGIGVGLATSLLGLLSIRFGVLPSFLVEIGLVNNNYLFLVLSILIASLSWIYAWRSPYRDLIFGALISGFLLMDYSLQLNDLNLIATGLFLGIFFIFVPGIHASWSKLTDNRFFLGGLLVYDLLLIKGDNLSAIIQTSENLYIIMVLLPIILFVLLFSLKKISRTYLWLCFPSSALILIINEVTFVNNYISDYVFAFLFIAGLILFAGPKFIFRKRVDYTLLNMGINIFIIFLHVIVLSYKWAPVDNWYIILIPAGINILILMEELVKTKIKLGYLIGSYWLTIIPFGIYTNVGSIFIGLLVISLILTFLVFFKDYQSFSYGELFFLIGSLFVIALGSIFTIFTLWEVESIPLVIPFVILILLLFKSKSNNKNLIHPMIVFPMIIQVFLTFTQSIFATYIFYEYVLITMLYGAFLVLSKNKIDSNAIYWFVNYLGFLGLFVYAEYDITLDYACFILISLLSFVIIVLYLPKFSTIRIRQLFYDSSNFLLFFGLFSLIILEKFKNEYFLLAFIVLLLCTVFIDTLFLRNSGIDFTLSILLPSFLVIGKELFVTQFLSQQVSPTFAIIEFLSKQISLTYAVIEFLTVALFASIFSIFSKHLEKEESLISPTVTAMFSIELVLIVLFFNKNVIDYNAIGTTIFMLILITLVIFVQKAHLFHFEYLILVLTSIMLALVIPLSENVDKSYYAIVLFILPLFWFVLRFKIKTINFVLDSILYIFLVFAEYLISLELPNSLFIQFGLLSEQLIIIVSILSIFLNLKRMSIQNLFYLFLEVQIPIWLSIGVLFDLELNTKFLYSKFTNIYSMNGLLSLNITLLVLFLALSMFYLKKNFEENISQSLLAIGTVTYLTLGLLIIQLIISQYLNNSFFNGTWLIILLVILQILTFVTTKANRQINTSNQVIIFSSFYIILTVIVFLMVSGLVSGLLALLGTGYLIITKDKNVREEIKFVGIIFLLFGIFKMIFDIIYNFDTLLLEIAFSSSILAVCLLLLGMIFINKDTGQESHIIENEI